MRLPRKPLCESGFSAHCSYNTEVGWTVQSGWTSWCPPLGSAAAICMLVGFPRGSEIKASACNAGDLGSTPGLGISPGEGNVNPLQYSYLENPMDGGACWAAVHGVAKSQTQLSDFTPLFTHLLINKLHCIIQLFKKDD